MGSDWNISRQMYEACPESVRYTACRPVGKFLCLLWQHCRRPWSFTCKPCSFDSGRTGFVWVRRVWNGSADPKSRQMRGAFRHTICQCKLVNAQRKFTNKFPLVSSPEETSRWEKVRRRWWGARRSHDVVQRAGGRLLWLGDTEAGSKT